MTVVRVFLRDASKRYTNFVHVLVDLNQKRLPDDLVGIVHPYWRWPDPRKVLSKLQYTIIEAKDLAVFVTAVTEVDLPHVYGIDPLFKRTMAFVSPIPPLPLYPILKVKRSAYHRGREAFPLQVPNLRR